MNKKMYQAAVLAALGLASVTAAQAVTYNGDLLVGFTTQSGNDLVYDLGSFSSLTYGETWDLTSALAAAGLGSSVSTAQWGIVGNANSAGIKYSWLTTADGSANPVPNSSAWLNINSADSTIFSSLSAAGMGNYGTPSSSASYSWNQETAQGGSAAPTAFSNYSQNPNSTGLGTVTLSQQIDNGSAPTQAGYFGLAVVGSSDILSFQTVPEPGSCALMAVGGGFLMLIGRNKFGRKQS
jgi:hypothetical protein